MEEETWEILLKLANDPKQLTLENTFVKFERDAVVNARISKTIKFVNNAVNNATKAEKCQTKLFL